MKLRRIISGGQTGVDQGGLEAAISSEFEHGGTCPRGRRSEEGPVPPQFVLEEHSSPAYPPRTRKNVEDADGTLILVLGQHVTAGTRLTAKLAQEAEKPWLAVDMQHPQAVDKAVDWLRDLDPEVLNIAGPRESKFRGIQRTTAAYLRTVIDRLREK